MTRTTEQLMHWAEQQPDDTFLAITVAEARQFISPYWSRTTRIIHPLRLMGRPCIVIDLPPGRDILDAIR